MAQRVFQIVKGTALGALAAALLTVPVVPQAKADLWNQRTVVTFSQPVEIPGRVLGPGTYVMQLADSPSGRNIVQIFNKDQNRLLATEFTVPAYRENPVGHTVVTLEERPVNNPEAIHDWYYPGMIYGHQFIYNR